MRFCGNLIIEGFFKNIRHDCGKKIFDNLVWIAAQLKDHSPRLEREF